MCGIVGLHAKTGALHERLGAHLATMLDCMTSRGPDSAGIAIYDDFDGEASRYSVRHPEADFAWEDLATRLTDMLGTEVTVVRRGDGAVLVADGDHDSFAAALSAAEPQVTLVGYGRAMEIVKDVGTPRAICDRYAIAERSGYQGLGHTRMATESAVTTDHSHPFAAAADLCLVHNGSFSNYASVRRELADEGVVFQTDNDSEVAARFIARELATGSDLGDSLRLVLKEFDGFFTLLVTTATQFAVVRDPFACKPAVVAETDDYVAMASEYHALADLPGIETARVFEPMPEEVHVWSR
jgi:methylamine---glutamate N-methyltransferase subunit A